MAILQRGIPLANLFNQYGGSSRLPVNSLLGYDVPQSVADQYSLLSGQQQRAFPNQAELFANNLTRGANPQASAQPQGFLNNLTSNIGQAFTGPGSTERLQALSAALLQGPSRTPISFGSQLAKGLLAGTQLAQAAKDKEEESLLRKATIDAKLREASGFDKTFKNEKDMRTEYNALTKDFREALVGFNKVKSAANVNTGAGDIALIFGFMKTIDPGSVVRESEFDLAQDTGGAPEQAKALIGKVINGQRLTPDQRQYFIEAAASQMDAIVGSQSDIEKRYTYLASRYGYDPVNIVDPYSSQYKKPSSKFSGTASNPIVVLSQAEGDKLEKGTYYSVGSTVYQSTGGSE